MMKKLICFILLFANAFVAQAQNAKFTSVVDTNAIVIGDQFTLTLSAELDKGSSYNWPNLPDTLEGFEIVKISDLDSIKRKGKLFLEQKFSITSFDSGYYVIPSFFLYAQEQSIASEPIGIAVRFPEISEEQDYYDIKGVLSPGLNWKRIILISSIGLVFLIALIYLLIRIYRNKIDPDSAPKMILRPYAQAFEDLDKLEKEELWQNGEIKTYYSRLVDILRNYIQRELKISALESTAEELIESLHRTPLPKEHFKGLKNMLRTSALVKFAKVKPTGTENQEAIVLVREFVEITRPKPEVKKDSNAE